MAIKTRIVGVESVIRNLKKKAEKFGKQNVVGTVGFATKYAIHVHERMDLHHPKGQAKFLEQPFRQLVNDGTLLKMIEEDVKKGIPLAKAIHRACLRIQRDAQKLVPVDTGALRASAFTEVK